MRVCILYEPVFVYARGDGAQLCNECDKKLSESDLVHAKNSTSVIINFLYMLSITNKMQRNNIPYCCQSSTCFRRFPRPSSGAQKLYILHLLYVQLLLLLAVAAIKLNKYQMLYVQFLSS